MAVFQVLLAFAINISILEAFLVNPSMLPSFGVDFCAKLAATPQRRGPEIIRNAFDLVDEVLVEGLSKEFGILEPNEVQNSSLPIALRGDNVFVIAQTGSGKTMSFMLPILHRFNNVYALPLSSPSRRSNPVAIVIGPTPELLAQHAAVASKLSPLLAERILFKTPEELLGRNSITNTNTNIEDEVLNLTSIDIVAIDEVDAVLCGSEFNDTAPETSIALLDRLPQQAQYILTTAHLTRAHTTIINRLFPDIEIVRQSSGSQRVLVPTLRQVFHYFNGDMTAKLDKLQDILQKSEKHPTIIFCRDQNEVEVVHSFLQNNCEALSQAFAPKKLHEKLSPEERFGALSEFKDDSNTTNTKNCRMLVTHEIVSRGLDCPSVRHVVLFDTPTDVTAFVHRAGRTARAGEEGVVTCLVQTGGAGGIGSFGDSGGSFGKHKNLHALLDAPKLSFAKASDGEILGNTKDKLGD